MGGPLWVETIDRYLCSVLLGGCCSCCRSNDRLVVVTDSGPVGGLRPVPVCLLINAMHVRRPPAAAICLSLEDVWSAAAQLLQLELDARSRGEWRRLFVVADTSLQCFDVST